MDDQQVRTPGPHSGLLDWLGRHDIPFVLHEHGLTYTARETARVEHIDPATFAKAVGVVADDGRRALLVLDADDHVDLLKARRILGSHVRLMTELELQDACPGCEVGATPPIGELFGLPTYVDDRLRGVATLMFHAGSHTHSVRVAREAWERSITAMWVDLVEHRSLEPAWMLS